MESSELGSARQREKAFKVSHFRFLSAFSSSFPSGTQILLSNHTQHIMSGQGVDLQEKIAAARREADGLKEQIRSRKDKMADTSCE